YKQGFFGSDPTTHFVSMALQISETKVKSLIYEMELRDIHKNKEGWLKNRLKKASINYDPTKGIRISASNKLFMSALTEAFDNLKAVPEFETNVICVSPDKFGALLDTLLDKDEIKTLREGVGKIQKFSVPTEKSVGSLFKKMAEKGLLKGAGEIQDLIFAENSTEIMNFLQNLPSG
ncbi:hypothetical protein OAA86_08515, partial [Rhodospirillales bacterium]|nr:hypothetical protein [Rhodospirillales bacterium]